MGDTRQHKHPIIMLRSYKGMFKIVILKILPSKADACVFSGTVSGDLFCSFAWAMSSCFFVYLVICCLKLHIKKNQPPLSDFEDWGLRPLISRARSGRWDQLRMKVQGLLGPFLDIGFRWVCASFHIRGCF